MTDKISEKIEQFTALLSPGRLKWQPLESREGDSEQLKRLIANYNDHLQNYVPVPCIGYGYQRDGALSNLVPNDEVQGIEREGRILLAVSDRHIRDLPEGYYSYEAKQRATQKLQSEMLNDYLGHGPVTQFFPSAKKELIEVTRYLRDCGVFADNVAEPIKVVVEPALPAEDRPATTQQLFLSIDPKTVNLDGLTKAVGGMAEFVRSSKRQELVERETFNKEYWEEFGTEFPNTMKAVPIIMERLNHGTPDAALSFRRMDDRPRTLEIRGISASDAERACASAKAVIDDLVSNGTLSTDDVKLKSYQETGRTTHRVCAEVSISIDPEKLLQSASSPRADGKTWAEGILPKGSGFDKSAGA